MQRQYDDTEDDFDRDMDQRTRGVGGRSGRIILLGDGTEVLTDSDEQEMFDHGDEDRDLEAQVSKGQPQTEDSESRKREATPGPESEKGSLTSHTPDTMEDTNPFDSPASNSTERSATAEELPPYVQAANSSDIPEKLTTPTKEP